LNDAVIVERIDILLDVCKKNYVLNIIY